MQIEHDLAHGNLVAAESKAHTITGTSRFLDRNDALAWKVRVLEARIDVLEGKSREALLLLAPQIPARLDNGDLEIQQEMLRAMAYVRLGQLPAATVRSQKSSGALRSHALDVPSRVA